MNYQYQFENNLDSMQANYTPLVQEHQLNQQKLQQIGSGMDPSTNGSQPLGNRLPLSRTSSLMDTLGIQRSSSPFTASAQVQQAQPQHNSNQGFGVNSEFYYSNIVQGTTTPSSTQFGSTNQPSMSSHSMLFNRPSSAAGTPVQNHSSMNLLPQFNNPGLTQNQPHLGVASQMSYPVGMPPGVTLPIPIQESQWKYIDTMGQLQGPFESSKMDYWLSNGYFPPTLQVSRITNSGPDPLNINNKFTTVGEILKISGSYYNPFSAIDNLLASSIVRPLNNKHAIPSSMPSNAASSIISDNLTKTNSVNINSIQPEISTSLQVKSEKSARDSSDKIPNVKEISSASLETDRTFNYEELLNWKGKDGSFFREATVQVPIGKTKKEKLDPNFIIPEPIEITEKLEDLIIKPIETDIEEPQPIKVSEKAKEGDFTARDSIKEADQANGYYSNKKVGKPKSQQDKPNDELKEQALAVEKIPSRVSTPNHLNSNLAPWAKSASPKVESSSTIASSLEDLKKNTLSKKQEEQNRLNEMRIKQQQLLEEEKRMGFGTSIVQSATTPTTPLSNLAPWASKVNTVEPVSIPSLQELKKFEKQKMKNEKVDMATTLKWSPDLFVDDKKEQEMKSMLNWAQKPQAPPPTTKIELPIQTQKKTTNGSINNKKSEPAPIPLQDFKNSSFIEEQKKIWEEVQSTSRSKPSAPETDNWTTVTSKAPKVNVQAKTVNQPSSYISPDQLRTISSNSSNRSKQIGSSTSIPTMKQKPMAQAVPQASYPGNASSALRQEFIRWCKSQMKLDSGVQVNNVLEVLFSLPTSLDSVEIIADTIYSNTSSMDGKRFATEFIKKKMDVEGKINDPLTWSEALKLPEGEVDDWEFQVVTKKKGRRH